MSEGHEHTSIIKTPGQLIAVVVASFLIPIIVIVILTQFVTGGMENTTQDRAEIAKRIEPVANLKIVDPNAPKVERSGQEISQTVCAACHASGAMNAPKVGDKAAWAPRISKGLDKLINSALHGINAMPPKGGNMDLSDTEVSRAVVYMANQSGASFKEPAAKPNAPPVTAVASPTAGSAQAATGSAPATNSTGTTVSPTASAPSTPTAPSSATQPTSQATSDASDKGKSVYSSACIACHGAGLLNAPKLGDKAAWAPRIKQGKDALYNSALHGKNAMPAKGGNTSLSDADVKAAVDYMIGSVK